MNIRKIMNFRNVLAMENKMTTFAQKSIEPKLPELLASKGKTTLPPVSPKLLKELHQPVFCKKNTFTRIASTILSPLNKIFKKGKVDKLPKLDLNIKPKNYKELICLKEDIKIDKVSCERILKEIEELGKSKDVFF